MKKFPDEILTLTEVAQLARYNVAYLRRVYPFWVERGVRILKAAPNARPRFFKEDILKLLQEAK